MEVGLPSVDLPGQGCLRWSLIPSLREDLCAYDILCICGYHMRDLIPKCISDPSSFLDMDFSLCLKMWKIYSANLLDLFQSKVHYM